MWSLKSLEMQNVPMLMVRSVSYFRKLCTHLYAELPNLVLNYEAVLHLQPKKLQCSPNHTSTSTNVLIDSGSETNAVHPPYAAKLGLSVRTSDVKPNRSMDHPARPLGQLQQGFLSRDKSSWGCLSLPLAVQAWGLQRGSLSGGVFKCRGHVHDQEGKDHE